MSALSVLHLTSDGIVGQLPAGRTLTSVQEETCENKHMFISWKKCLHDLVSSLTKTGRCSSTDIRHINQNIKQIAVKLLSTCKQVCRQHLTEKANQCLTLSNSSALFSSMTILQDKFLFIGTSKSSSDQFCRERQKIFSCLHKINHFCIYSYVGRLLVKGFDINAMQKGSRFLCAQQHAHLEAVHCFSRNSDQVSFCQNKSLLHELFKQHQHHQIPPVTFIDDLCRLRILQVECELRVYARVCPNTAWLKREFECISLPPVCRRLEDLHGILTDLCGNVTITYTIPVQHSSHTVELPLFDKNILEVSSGNSLYVSFLLFFIASCIKRF
ncbi:uncharacterized protein LOC121390401 isoform X2 [Gigantopelta aegis]|nr:uncharacterized protein LOC121390401 isoform X2 [Gigantopelta aegis]